MSRIGLISNTRSQRNQRGMAAIRAALSLYPQVQHAEIGEIQEVGDILREFARREVDHVIVNGGDGTVQATLTELFNGAVFERFPLLSILPGGMTNLIAQDVGLKGQPVRSLVRLIEATAAGDRGARLTRPVLSMTYAPHSPPVHGMFLGTAAFYRSIQFSREKVHSLGVVRSAATGLALGLILLRAIAGKAGDDRLIQGERIAIELDGQGGEEERDYFIVLVTTLEHLTLGLMPFWGSGDGMCRYTSIGFPPQRLHRALLPLLRGRPRPWMAENGYLSGRAGEIALRMSCPIVFDGQIYTPMPDFPVILRADHKAVFLRC